MRRIAFVACASALASCAAPQVPPGPDRGAQEAACTAAVAAHVGLPPEAVATRWRETGASGVAIFEIRDGGRMHTCEADAGGRVLRILHPAPGA